MAALDAVLTTIDANLDASRERLFDLLRIPSVSTDPAYSAQCLRAANWLKDQLNGLGYEAQVRETPGHPIVVGHAKAKRKDAPHVLFYGHYDVQPARSAGTVGNRAFRASPCRRQGRQGHRRPRRLGRQRPADDLSSKRAARSRRMAACPATSLFCSRAKRRRGRPRFQAFSPRIRTNSRRPISRSSATPACGTRRRRRSR